MNQSRGATVLLVDDEPDVRQALRLVLEFEEFSIVAEAGDGLDAVRLAAEHQPNFVILDYYMPRMNGHKSAKLIREIAPDSCIVAFSAVLEEKPRWADAYLNKDLLTQIPIVLKELSSPRTASTLNA